MGIFRTDDERIALGVDAEKAVIEALRRYAVALQDRHDMRLTSVRFSWEHDDGKRSTRNLKTVQIDLESP